MTSEVIIMNRNAIVVAADSAVTVSRYVKGEKEERYFKGANKVFELSVHDPIGIMINGNSQFERVAWEIFIKDFRKKNKNITFDTVEECCDKFFDFIKSHPVLTDSAKQEKTFLSHAVNSINMVCHLMFMQDQNFRQLFDHYSKAQDPDEKVEITKTLRPLISLKIRDFKENLADGQFIDGFDDEDCDSASVKYLKKIMEDIDGMLPFAELLPIEEITKIAIEFLFKTYDALNEDKNAGLVIFGYGDKEYFPIMCEFACYGLLEGRLIYNKKDKKVIDENTPSHIQPFAMTLMSSTFLHGIGPDLFAAVSDGFEIEMKELCEEIKDRAELESLVTDDLVEKRSKQFTAILAEISRKDHKDPILSVINSLPHDDMVNLAETLINLEALKERVTRSTEYVGGPVDLAIVTKGDGFVWINRKHYFDASLNYRYYKRQERLFN